MNELYNRVVKPLLIPLTAGAFIAVLVYSFSRILLAVPEAGSTILAIVLAAEILGVGAVIAAARRVSAAQKSISILLGLALIGGGGVAAAIGEREFGHHEEEPELSITAQDIAFVEQEVTVPADEPFELAFVNQDAGVPHNVAVYTDDSASEALFQGEIFNGVATTVYEIPALPAGSHFFRCDVHPEMTGTMTAGEGGGEPTPTGSPTDGATPTAIEITAEAIQFDTTAFTLAADTETTITFVNDDEGVPHNVAIYPSKEETSEADGLFVGEIFAGAATREYELPPIPAGEHYFRCDVHPNMGGRAAFR